MWKRSHPEHLGRSTILIASTVVVIAIVVGFLLWHHQTHTSAARKAALSAYCVGQTFTTNDTGHCVSDIQTLVNYMEDSGLTECSFTDGAKLDITGTYDAATATQVQSIQNWAVCYAKQEGFASNVHPSSTVDRATWGELCTFSYIDPIRNSATDAGASIAAGSNAGCAQLNTKA